MAARDDILAFCDELLDVESYPDYGPIGLQVVGAAEVRRLVCGVSASRELFERGGRRGRAARARATTGSSGSATRRWSTPLLRDRLRTLFDADLKLAAYHLALDAHPEIGNNAFLCRELGIDAGARASPTSAGAGRSREPRDARATSPSASRRSSAGCRSSSRTGPEEIRRVAVCSGGAARRIARGRSPRGTTASSRARPPSRRSTPRRRPGIHFVAAGHYATETSGVQLLAERVGRRASASSGSSSTSRTRLTRRLSLRGP